MSEIKRKTKDSLFTNFFSQKENTIQLYKVLHPEDTTATINDVQIITIENVIVNDIYNDLGFMLRGKLFILVEAQSTWNDNMAIRSLMYLCETYKRYLKQNGYDLLSPSRLKIPEPELYVIYTGTRKNKPEYMCISENFISNSKKFLELKVKMIYNGEKNDVVYQYISFCKILDEQRKKFLNEPHAAILETLRLCKDNKIMEDYITTHENEVYESVSDMLYRIHVEHLKKEAEEKVRAKAMAKGLAEGRAEGLAEGRAEGLAEGRAEGLAEGRTEGLIEGSQKKAVETALNFLKMGLSAEQVAQGTGLSISEVMSLKAE